MKKIDTHVHTSEVSSCGKLTAAEIVSRYIDAGYDAIVITDHLLLKNIIEQDMKPYEVVERQLKGYMAALEAADGRIGVFMGAEIRFTGGSEDFLLFGLDVERYFELARRLPDSVQACHELMGSMGGLIYQAHPYRPGLTPAPARFLNGVEVYNGNPRHNSHNDDARRYAEINHLHMLSGSDAHQVPDIARGGILMPDWVRSNAELVRYLRETPVPDMIVDGNV